MNNIDRMNLLNEEFKFANVIYSENGETLKIIGPRDEKYNFATFLCAYRSPIWNVIPKKTKVIFKDIMIEKNDNKLGGDVWCAQWLINYFENNFSFENCYYTHFNGNNNGGNYIITSLVSTTDKLLLKDYGWNF